MKPRSEQPVRVRLYVAPHSRASRLAQSNLQAAVELLEVRDAQIEVIDVTEQPKLAARDGALVTPLLVRLQPEPVRKVGGTLDDRDSLLALLNGVA